MGSPAPGDASANGLYQGPIDLVPVQDIDWLNTGAFAGAYALLVVLVGTPYRRPHAAE